MKSYLVNLSGVFAQEGWAEEALSGSARLLDFSQLPGTCGYCDPDAQAVLSGAFRQFSAGPAVCWIDTGDYHYLSALRLQVLQAQAFALLLLDHHSDRQTPAMGPSVLSCGGWVQTALSTCPGLKQVCTVGAGNAPGDFPGGCSPEELLAVLQPDLPLFISLDLDVLSPEWFRCDWDQGSMTLPQLFSLLEAILPGRIASGTLLGIDICGGFTRERGATHSDLALNLRTRKALSAFLQHLP